MTESGRPVRRKDASMTLLTAVMERPLDPGYAAAAQRKAEGSSPAATLPSRLLIMGITVLIGLGIAVATLDLRSPQAEPNNARELIVGQIRERSATTETLRTRNSELREEISALQSQFLGGEAEELLERTTNLEVAVGTAAVTGQGLVVTIEDSARAQAGEPDTELERVQDQDLQLVVNGLWASGAEAIAVNGHRLTALTAIRTAGDAILVDLQPLVSPYHVEAIGDPEQLRTEFARSGAQAHLGVLSSAYSIPSSLDAADDLSLPAADSPQVAYATGSS